MRCDLAVVLGFLLALAACGSTSNTSPTPVYPVVTGNWSGTMQTDNRGTNTVTFALTSTNNLVTGTWTSPSGWSGSVTGALSSQGSFTGAMSFSSTNPDGSPCTGSGTFGGAFSSSLFSASSNGFTGSCNSLPAGVIVTTRKQ